MDVSRFRTSDWLKMGGALGMLIFGFFEWVSIDSGFGDVGGGNVFDFFWTGTLPWILVIGSGILTFLLVQGIMKRNNTPWDTIIFAALALAALLLLIRLLFNPIDGADELEDAGVDIGRGIGMYLSVLSGLVAAVGGFLAFKESGGSVDDFKRLGANRGSGTGSGSGGGSPSRMAPPPPPGSSTPPPPPPPPPSR
jgi:hypothetical protein